EADSFESFAVEEELEKTEREESAADFLDAGIEVEEAEDRADRFAVDFGDGGHFGNNEHFQAVRHRLGFRRRNGDEAPGADERLVINFQEQADVAVEMFGVETRELDVEPPLALLDEEVQVCVRGSDHVLVPPGGD